MPPIYKFAGEAVKAVIPQEDDGSGQGRIRNLDVDSILGLQQPMNAVHANEVCIARCIYNSYLGILNN